VLCGIALTRLDIRHPINTDILSLLPGEQQSPALAAATDRSREAFVRQVLVLVGGDDTAQTRGAALAAQKALLAAGLQADDSGQTLDRLLAAYQTHPFALLDAAQSARLAKDGANALATDVAVSLASPAGMVNVFGSDPGGYLGRFMAGLPRPYPDFLPDGPFLSALRDGHRYFLVQMDLSSSAFAEQGASLAASAVSAAQAAVLQACPACTFQATGAPLFADVARREAQRETQWLGIVSTLLIMVLIAFVFRSLAPHVLAGLQLVASILAASAAVIACFGSIQILTLVFGTTLLGIAVDYAFLYFAEYWFGDSAPQEVMRAVRPGLYMGLLTGIVAFAFLLFAGFPALDQIAVFSVAGLLEAGLVVVLIFPITLTTSSRVAAHPAVDWPREFIARACRVSRWRHVLPVLALLLAAPGWLRLHASDDVRELQHFPPQLMQTDQQIRSTLGQIPPPGFFLIEAPDLEQALNREEALFADVRQTLPDVATLGLSRLLPSAAQQRASLAAWSKALESPSALDHAFARFGLPAELARHIETEWRAAPHEPLAAETLLDAEPELKTLVIPDGGGVALLATVSGRADIDPAVLQGMAAAVPGTSFIAPLTRITDTFRRIRVRATWLVISGYLLISALLVWRYGRREAVRMLYPPLLALGVTLGALGWLGEPINIFVVVALILILGLGRDYAVFLREGGAGRRSPALAVTLSALTTLCGFGLLALSQIPALHAFGLATLIGILASYLSAPLSLPPDGREPA
jgi:predicted exporter